MKVKEFGSDFHCISDKSFRTTNTYSNFFGTDFTFFFSGRSAFYTILENGIKEFDWQKIYVPSYYCHEVYDFLRNLNIQIVFYHYNPLINEINLNIEDSNLNVFLNVNYFGISLLNIDHFQNIVKIEDNTHHFLNIKKSKADFVFGSLRKILPVPVGGFLKINNNKYSVIAKAVTLEAEEVCLTKFSGMYIKSQYLKGDFKDKAVFRELLMNGEKRFEDAITNSELPSMMDYYLKTLDVEKIIQKKKENSYQIKRLINTNKLFDLLIESDDNEFACILKFKNTDVRNQLSTFLVEKSIYPIVLWPNQKNNIDKDIENKLLFIHIDFRYNEDDMKYISNVINQFTNDYEF